MNGQQADTTKRHGNFKRILFCTDFSENSGFAFGFAIDAALRNKGSTLYLMHVLPEPDAQFWKSYIYAAEGDPDAKARADIDALIARDYLPRLPPGLDLQKVFRIGKASDEILGFAAEIQADLIVIGRQGKGAMRSIFFGDVASRVARHATCPLLIIPMAFARRPATRSAELDE
ncbi:MAG: universal stress protein [Lentisphaerae bacterium]|jgi:nucleotide-binding universal stress UspA family protein|nr:universal stress protein [Lentisphaerota bacterium]